MILRTPEQVYDYEPDPDTWITQVVHDRIFLLTIAVRVADPF